MGKLKDSIKHLGLKINGVEPAGYYTTELLKDFGETLTGKTISGKQITEVITSIADNYEPALTLTVAPAPADADLFGKHTPDLAENLTIGANAITGTLKYVTGYTGFSSKTAEQKGNYLPLYATVNKEGAVITIEIVGGTKGPVTLDADGLYVGRIANNEQSIQIKAIVGEITITKNYSLADLVLTPEPAEQEA